MDSTWLFAALLFSLIGTVALLYGWRQRLAAPTIVGLVLSLCPYFVDGVVALIVIGVLLIGALFVGLRMEQDV